jgi:8-oxo-dGTP diphosphatase
VSPEIGKVIAYITNGRRLLVFRHTRFPEAGIQVPAGTIEAGEAAETAVLREVHEETGLEDLILVGALGQRRQDRAEFGKEGQEIRHFFHLHCDGRPAERWRHVEQFPSEGPHGALEFEFYWVAWPDDVPRLAGAQDALLAKIPWDSLPS